MKKMDNALKRTLALIDLRIPFVINPILQKANRYAASLMTMNDWDKQMVQVREGASSTSSMDSYNETD